MLNRLPTIDLGGVGQLGSVWAIQLARETTHRPSPPFWFTGSTFTLPSAPKWQLSAVSERQNFFLHHDIPLVALNKTAIQHFVWIDFIRPLSSSKGHRHLPWVNRYKGLTRAHWRYRILDFNGDINCVQPRSTDMVSINFVVHSFIFQCDY